MCILDSITIQVSSVFSDQVNQPESIRIIKIIRYQPITILYWLSLPFSIIVIALKNFEKIALSSSFELQRV